MLFKLYYIQIKSKLIKQNKKKKKKKREIIGVLREIQNNKYFMIMVSVGSIVKIPYLRTMQTN